MLSKSPARATALALALVVAGCARVLPWRDTPPAGAEVNFAFTLDRNLIEMQTVTLDGRTGRFVLGTATPRTVIDDDFPLEGTRGHTLQLRDKNTVRLSPLRADLAGAADAILGADVWRNHAISINYHNGLVTYQRAGIHPGLMQLFSYDYAPTIYITVDGRRIAAIVDTASPDTLTLPGTRDPRGTAHVFVAVTDFGPIDVGYADIPTPRIGNRLLSRFLITVDYGKRVVGLYRDTRIPLRAEPQAPVVPDATAR